MCDIEIRTAVLDDTEKILDIYRYYVLNTAITFEYTVPTVEEFKERIAKTLTKYPYLVAVQDDTILGYAYAGEFVGRAAYGWSAELTIYLAQNARKCGLGRRLYEKLEQILKEMGVLNLYACIGYPERDDEYLTKNSAEFHKHMGFEKVGEFHKCGYKFNHWYNMIWMEKIIGTHEKEQRQIKYQKQRKDLA